MSLRTVYVAVGTVMLVARASAAQALSPAELTERDQEADVRRIERGLRLNSAQVAQILPVLRQHEVTWSRIREDTSLTPAAKQQQLRADRVALASEIRPYLTDDQQDELGAVLRLDRSWLRLQAAAYSSIFIPSDARTREIFGGQINGYGVDLEGYEPNMGSRSRFVFSADTFSMSGTNRVFALAADGHFEERFPFGHNRYAYVNLRAGPAFFSYSYTTPEGDHFGGKRFGAGGGVELGVKWGALRVSIAYTAFTEPSGLSFDGFSALATVSLLRFAYP